MDNIALIIIALLGIATVSHAQEPTTSEPSKLVGLQRFSPSVRRGMEEEHLADQQKQLKLLKDEYYRLTRYETESRKYQIARYATLIKQAEDEIKITEANIASLKLEEKALADKKAENLAIDAPGVRDTQRHIPNERVDIPKTPPRFNCGSTTGKLTSDAASKELRQENCDPKGGAFTSEDLAKQKSNNNDDSMNRKN
jgi:hypothetical protein